jgi:hypothetical protein
VPACSRCGAHSEQYFACEPLCGIFCKPHQLSVVAASSLDATARPQSAMSQRSGRTSALGSESGRTSATGFRRAATPESGMRPRSSMAMVTPAASRSNGVRPPSVTPHSRPSSSMSTRGRPSSVLSHSSSTSRPASRLGPRKSHADLALDEAGRRRAKTSAEAAAEAEARIHVGSRAARFINAKAADLVATRREPEPAASASAARPASPLKDSLLARGRTSMGTPSAAGAGLRPPRAAGPPVTPLGGVAAPRMAKARTSGVPAPFAAPRLQAAEAMGPPASPSRTEGSEELRKSTGARPASALSSHGANDSSPRTPGKGESNGHESEGTVRKTRQRSSVHALLEEMDLTPRRPGILFSSDGIDERQENGSPSRADSVASDHGSSVVEPVVPVSMLEEAQADIEMLKEQLATLSREAAAAKKAEAQERERARAAATEAVRRELDEEREVERADQLRRRRETEEREAAAREKLQATHREAVERINAEHARRVEELQSKLGEGEETLADLKRALGGEEKEKSAALVKDAEIVRLKERLARVEASLASERETLQAEINDLTQSGQEMSS